MATKSDIFFGHDKDTYLFIKTEIIINLKIPRLTHLIYEGYDELNFTAFNIFFIFK